MFWTTAYVSSPQVEALLNKQARHSWFTSLNYVLFNRKMQTVITVSVHKGLDFRTKEIIQGSSVIFLLSNNFIIGHNFKCVIFCNLEI